MAKKKHVRRRARLRPFQLSVLRVIALLLVYGLSAAAGGLYFVVSEVDRGLPRDLTSALDYVPERASLVYSADGELIGEFFLHKRVLVDLDRVPAHVQHAFIAAEDQRFLEHQGFDLSGMVRAAWANLRAGHTTQGASTITQQVTRMLLLSNEKSYRRKMREIVLAVRVERELTKREILHIYLNHVYLGHGAYGVEAAADVYFGKRVDHLTAAEGAMLAGLVQGPSIYSPHLDMRAARARQTYVLERMLADGYISDSQHQAAMREPVALIDDERPLNHVGAPYFVEEIRKWATRRFGEDTVFHGGLRIYTTLDTRMQRSAEAAIRTGLGALDQRIGFRGPIGHLEGAELGAMRDGPLRPHVTDGEVVTGGDALVHGVPYVAAVIDLPRGGVTVDLGPFELALADDDAARVRAWQADDGAVLRTGDLLPITLRRTENGRAEAFLAQRPDVQGALVAMEPVTGRVRAMVGGYDFATSRFNRATQARRQIGSAMKPFIYAAAMRQGATQLDIVNDAPVAVRTAGGVWRPKNYNGRFEGPVTLRTALAASLNTVSVRLLISTGLERVIELMRDVGIESPIPHHVSIALGTPDLSLLEVVSGIAAFPSGGARVTPRLVDRVLSGSGEVLVDYESHGRGAQVITPELAYLVVDLMQAVVERGTGRRALVLGRPAAGKTGTSTGHRDAWFMGYTADLVAGVWIGRDDFTPIGAKATGGSAALPVWLQFMQSAHPATPPRAFPAPDDITFVRANELTGAAAGPGDRAARMVPFARGTVPARFLGGDAHFATK